MKKMIILALGLSVILIASPATAAFFLHGTGPNDNPPALFLDNTTPAAATAKYRDSVGVKFSGGNLWKEIGTWTVTTTGALTELNNLHVWLGLKNSDDIGTRFDLRAEVYKNGQFLITSGEFYCIQNITRNPDLAEEVTLSFGSFSPVDFSGTDALSLKILTRIGTNGAGTFCGGHSNAVGLRLYFDAVSRPSRFDATLQQNLPPVANAGQDQQVRVGDLVTLDGRNSYDPDGDLITYNWTITSAPSGSSAALNNPTSVMPSFVPDRPGNYIILLTVNDGQVNSSPDDVIVIAAQPNVAPTAIAGPDQSVVTGSQVFLDGRGSFDPDGDPLTYRWQLISLPAGSTAFLDNPSSPTPTFVADKDGQYVIVLTVNDGELDSLPDDVVVVSATPNAPPVAYAGDDQTVPRNTMISLSASGSYDPDNDPLTYVWSIVSSPEGSTSQFDDPASPTPKILVDREGDYVFRLAVSDGQLYSDPDTVVVKAVNDPPIADAGPDKSGVVSAPVSLDGSGSSDSNGDTLTYQWSVGSAPSGSTATISNPTSVTPTFTPDLPGTYTIQLVVNDGWVSSSPDTVRIEVIQPNRNPVATPGGPYTGVVGVPVQFDGSGSSDPDGDPITFNWDFGDSATSSGATPVHTYSSPGLYAVTLTVQDGKGGSGSAQTTANITIPALSITGFTPTEGPIGTNVTINGFGFDTGNLRVSFNGTSAVVSTFTKTSITTTVPMGAATGPITVTTSAGTATSASGFTVTSLYNFGISITPQNIKAAPNSQITYVISATGSDNFSSLITLNIQGLPDGFTALFSPKTITRGQSANLTITTCDCTLSSPATLTITGSSVIDGKTVTQSVGASLEMIVQGETTLTGLILDTDNHPIKGVVIRVGNSSTTTDESGNFLLENPPTGDQVVLMDGFPASTDTAHYPTIPITMNIVAGQTNSLPYVPHFHAQKNTNFTPINPTQDTIAEDPEIPDFQLRIPAGVDIIGWDGNPNTKVSIRRVPIDALPVPPPPPDVQAKTVYMFYFGKMGGGVPTTPIPVTAPNDLGLEPGEKANLWYYNESPNLGEAPNEWSIAGTGTVSEDGKTISTDPGVGIPRFCCGAIAWAPWQQTGPNIPIDPCEVGDPVDPSTGAFIHTQTDLTISGRIPIIIKRYYRTLDTFHGPYGIGTYFNYDWYLLPSGGMAILTIPPGTRISFTPQTDGTYINTNEPVYRGAVVTFNPDGTRTLRMKNGSTYKFDVYGLLVEQQDRNGNKLTFLREVEGNVTKIVDGSGRVMVTFSIWIMGRDVITQMADLTGRNVIYAYDTSADPGTGRLMSVTNPEGGVTQYQYDSQGRMKSIIDPRGNTVLNVTYDVNGRVCQEQYADGGTFSFYYITVAQSTTPDAIKLLSEAASGGPITTPLCSAAASNSPVAYTVVVDPNGNPKIYRFNGAQKIISSTDADGQVILTERDPVTNLVKSRTDALGRKTTYTYDNNGNMTSITDPVGNTTNMVYDQAVNKPLTITDPLGNVTTMTYDSKGNLIQFRTPKSELTTIDYDQYGEPLSVTDPMGNIYRTEYDGYGNLVKATDPLGNSATLKYDSLSRVIEFADPRGRTTAYNHDVMNRLKEVKDALNGSTRSTYDLNGNLLSTTDAKGQTTSYTYNSKNQVVSMTDQLGRTETYEYDINSNLIRKTGRKGQITAYTYDNKNQLKRVDYADGSYTATTYDAVGRLISINDSISGPIQYVYSGTGCSTCGGVTDKVIQVTTPLGGINYTYDALGRRTSMIAAGQPAVNYQYDPNSHLLGISTLNSQLGALNFAITYDASGRRISLTYPNGLSTNYIYDSASNLLNLKHLNSLNQILESINYTYDANGNRTNIQRLNVPVRLPDPKPNISFNSANEMLTFNDKSMTYDENGNLASVTNACGATTYTWDARNQLVAINGFTSALTSASTCDPLAASFKYDAFGRRIEKTVNGRTIQYFYDGVDIVQEIENGAVVANYLETLSIDEPLARLTTNASRFYQADALGSVIALTDETGSVKTRYIYDPYGNVSVSGEASDNPFQYTGRENDGTGLYYYRARYYSPELQRFISEDPIGLLGGVNLHRYVANSPVNWVDPHGLTGFHMHFLISFFAGVSVGLDPMTSTFIAIQSILPDLEKGSYKPENAYKHALRTEDQSPEAAQKKTEKYIREQMGCGTLKGFRRALHARQDSDTHRYDVNPKGFLSKHTLEYDIVPSPRDFWEAVKDSRQLIEERFNPFAMHY